MTEGILADGAPELAICMFVYVCVYGFHCVYGLGIGMVDADADAVGATGGLGGRADSKPVGGEKPEGSNITPLRRTGVHTLICCRVAVLVCVRVLFVCVVHLCVVVVVVSSCPVVVECDAMRVGLGRRAAVFTQLHSQWSTERKHGHTKGRQKRKQETTRKEEEEREEGQERG